ncbi:trypsin-like peptidase domain-containing protein [Candidatus Falkowbacteria bacterium]|nr:trypsin-like peptidase domain-containing protein [Candidatus Falkowbacteria bacterium]
MQKTNWGKAFLGDATPNAPTIDSSSTKVIKVEEESNTIDVVKKASAAVVSIVITKELDQYYNLTGPLDGFIFDIPQEKTGQKIKQTIGGGSGFIVSSDGLILTNKHVVFDDSAEYTVSLNDGREFKAKIFGKDPTNDIAILKIDAKNLPVLDLGNSDKIQTGQTAIAIGFSLAEYKNTVTKGVISGINRKVTASDYAIGATSIIDEAIQTDAAINQGNSGGPLLDLGGKVIGINTAVNRSGESVGFAIPINIAKKALDSVKKYGRIVRPWLGVRYVVLNQKIADANKLPVNYGALIASGQTAQEQAIVPNSPADKAGLKVDDIILEINGVKLDEKSLATELSKYNPKDVVTLKILRNGETKIIKVTLEERKE